MLSSGGMADEGWTEFTFCVILLIISNTFYDHWLQIRSDFVVIKQQRRSWGVLRIGEGWGSCVTHSQLHRDSILFVNKDSVFGFTKKAIDLSLNCWECRLENWKKKQTLRKVLNQQSSNHHTCTDLLKFVLRLCKAKCFMIIISVLYNYSIKFAIVKPPKSSYIPHFST